MLPLQRPAEPFLGSRSRCFHARVDSILFCIFSKLICLNVVQYIYNQLVHIAHYHPQRIVSSSARHGSVLSPPSWPRKTGRSWHRFVWVISIRPSPSESSMPCHPACVAINVLSLSDFQLILTYYFGLFTLTQHY